MEEIWKNPLPEMEGYVLVSNLGRVKYLQRLNLVSESGKRKLKERIKKPSTNPLKYVEVSLPEIDGKRQRFHAHRLVALAFLPNPFNLPTVNHINGIKSDNIVENLEWASYGQNNQHAYDTGLKKFNHETTCKMKSADVVLMREEIKQGARTIDMARKYGINRRSVVDIKYGRSWAHLL